MQFIVTFLTIKTTNALIFILQQAARSFSVNEIGCAYGFHFRPFAENENNISIIQLITYEVVVDWFILKLTT